MTTGSNYIIAGGDAGARRLRVLAQATLSGTLAVLGRAGLQEGMAVLDLGCGSGDVTVEIARRVGPRGHVVGVDMDDGVLSHGRHAAQAAGVAVEWRCEQAPALDERERYDLVYARFLLSHLADPAAMVRRMLAALRPEGHIVVEDIDISSHTHWPPLPAFSRYVELYQATASLRGVDATIGPRLPALLVDAGAEALEVSLSMPVFMAGEGKCVARLTLESISTAAIESGLTDRQEIAELLEALTAHEADPRSLQSIAQICQVTAQKRG